MGLHHILEDRAITKNTIIKNNEKLIRLFFITFSFFQMLRLSENAHLLRYPHPSSLRRTSMYASFLGISEALHLDIFHQPPRNRIFDSIIIRQPL